MTPSGLDEVRARLVAAGFRKRAGQVFTRELVDDVVGWLGLNRATRHRPAGEVEVNPVVGVGHQGVERIVAELRGEEFHAYQPPTVSKPLGYLMAEQRYRSWVIGDDGGSAGVAEDLVRAVEDHAVPFMKASVPLFRDRRLALGHSGTEIKTFEVPTSYVDDLRASAVHEDVARKFLDSPFIVDVNQAADQFGLRACHLPALTAAIVPGSGRSGC